MPEPVDRDLLFGLIALQNTLVTQDQLLNAFRSWSADRSRPLSNYLATRGALDTEDCAAVEALLARHLKKHGGDTDQSLAALATGSSACQTLVAAGASDIEATLTHIAAAESTPAGERSRADFSLAGAPGISGQRYRIVRMHARGGLGAVYLALDGELNREVALKQLLDAHADDPASRQRFLLEAEITGGLEHPGVVPVYGLGFHADGRPYYAMRFIRGASLKEAIDRFHALPDTRVVDVKTKPEGGSRELEQRRLMRRFLDVCNVIEYAHSQGVIHRDIKPANIIVGNYGETLVVDWGLAKVTGRTDALRAQDEPLPPAGSASGSAETLPGSALGTPAFMSPEQARGEIDAVGPRSDIYSLGATLYCLLTGKAPVDKSDVASILRAVREGEIKPPRQVDDTIDRALEAICLKALALRPEDRYASAKALADDVERWLADEPVNAYPSPWTDRLRRRLKRHRIAVVALAAATVVALAASVSLALVESRARDDIAFAYKQLQNTNRQAELDRDRAERSFRQAREAVNLFFTRVSEERLLNQPGLHPLRKALLQDAQPFYESFVDERSSDPALRADLAVARVRLAKINALVGADDEADRQFEQAIALWDKVISAGPLNTRHIHNFAQALNEQGVSLMRRRGRRADAGHCFERAIALLRPTLDDTPESIPRRRLYGIALTNKAWIEQSLGRPRQAMEDIQKALEVNSKAVAEDPTTESKLILANEYAMAGQVVMGGNDGVQPAIQYYKQAVALLEPIVREHPEYAEETHSLSLDLGDLSELHQFLGRFDEALAYLIKGYETVKALNARYPGVRNYQGALASTLNILADLHRRQNQYEQSLTYAQEGNELLKRLTAEHSTDAYLRVDLAKSFNNVGRCLQKFGKNAEALAAFEQAVSNYSSVADLDTRNTYNLACNLSLCVPLTGDPAARVELAQRALKFLRRAVDAGYVNSELILGDTDLDPLHPYREFQFIVLDLSMPRDVFAP